jgi:hypothetical protein
MELSDLEFMSEPDVQGEQFCSFLPFLLPALIGLGGTLIGGAMKNAAAERQSQQQYAYDKEAAAQQRQWDLEDRDEARAYSRQVYQQLVEDSEAAGFNPLTALRNGGGSAYNAAAAFAPLSRQAPVRQAPYQGGIGDAVSGFSANFMASFDPYQDQAKEQEFRLVQAQIDNLNASTAAIGSQSFKVPTYRAGNVERRQSGVAGLLSGGPQLVVPGEPTMTNPWEKSLVDPNVRDSQAFEDRYGDSEIGSMLYGGYTWVKDAYQNLKRTWNTRKPDPDAPKGWRRFVPQFGWSED